MVVMKWCGGRVRDSATVDRRTGIGVNCRSTTLDLLNESRHSIRDLHP
jgi:hypothetical protein